MPALFHVRESACCTSGGSSARQAIRLGHPLGHARGRVGQDQARQAGGLREGILHGQHTAPRLSQDVHAFKSEGTANDGDFLNEVGLRSTSMGCGAGPNCRNPVGHRR